MWIQHRAMRADGFFLRAGERLMTLGLKDERGV
jgi:hypothetical protein